MTAFQKQIEINPNIKWVNEIAIEVVNEMRKEAEARNRVGIETENTPSEK